MFIGILVEINNSVHINNLVSTENMKEIIDSVQNWVCIMLFVGTWF